MINNWEKLILGQTPDYSYLNFHNPFPNNFKMMKINNAREITLFTKEKYEFIFFVFKNDF